MKTQLPVSGSPGRLVFRFPKQPPPASQTPPGFRLLRLLMQPGTICIELLQSGLLLGRHSSADVRLSLPDVSRRHCRFLFSEDHWEVVDLNSLNGITVNDERLNQSVLNPGDILRIGSVTFVVEIDPPVRQKEPADKERETSALIQCIADHPNLRKAEVTQEYRKAS